MFNDKTKPLHYEITEYVNKNIENIIIELIDYLNDDNDFTVYDFLPYNNINLQSEEWENLVHNLYRMVYSSVIREYIKPIYEYLLYIILKWWEDCNDNEESITFEIDNPLTNKIESNYSHEEYLLIVNRITDFKEYYDIIFFDFDFLPDTIDAMTSLYLYNRNAFLLFFPDIDLMDYRILMSGDLQELFDEENEKSDSRICMESTLLEDLICCCRKLQSNKYYKTASENEMNDYIRDLLSAKGYFLRDQTRQGSSPEGLDAGEVDILMLNNNTNFSIIEALILTYLNKNYLNEHLDKIYNYDTEGLRNNFIISYVKAKNLNTFWDKYIQHIQNYKFKYPLTNLQPIKKSPILSSEIKLIVTAHNRNNETTLLFHIGVHIPT